MSLLVWDEVLSAWQEGDFRHVHDWLNERWARTVREGVAGEADPFARFLQGLAFAALAFHFAGEHNRESAALFVEDGLSTLSRFPRAYAGIEITPILDALSELQRVLEIPGSGETIPTLLASRQALRFARLAPA